MDKALAKLKSLKDVYQDFEEVKVGDDLKVKIKLLNSSEETEVHTYAANNFEQGIAYLYAIKRETICKAIVALNGTSIPEIVDDEDKNGVNEKVTRNIWLRENIVSGWTQIIVDEIWLGYSRLMERVELKIAKGTKREKVETEEINA